MDAKDPMGSLKAIKEDGRRRNPRWRKRWKNIVKYDQDWDYRYFLDILLHKLYLMYDRYTDTKQGLLIADDERQKMADSLGATIEIGERIRKNEYFDEGDAIAEAHSRWIPSDSPKGGMKTEWDSDKWQQRYQEIMFDEAPKKRRADIDAFFAMMAKNMESWWD